MEEGEKHGKQMFSYHLHFSFLHPISQNWGGRREVGSTKYTKCCVLFILGPARVTFTSTEVSLSFNEKGIIPCFIDASPAIQYVSWTKNGREIEIFEGSEIYTVNNGSLLIEKVNLL